MPHQPQPDSRTRALVPVLSFSLTAILCCAETTVTRPTVSTGRLDRSARSEPRIPETTPLPLDSDSLPTPPVETTPPPVPTPSAPIPTEPPAVRVRLERVRSPNRLPFGVRGDYRIVAGAMNDLVADSAPVVASGNNLGSAYASANNGSVRINGHDLDRSEVTILPLRPSLDGALSVGSRRYAGGLILRASGNELVAVNLVELEDYVLGVVYAEMPERFANEALRSQAVVSRTFALFHAQQGHELRDDQGSQVYVGMELVDPLLRRIVDSTAGEILTYQGIPFESYFHSTCGGRTSSARDVFGINAPPPLTQGAVCTTCGRSPHATWTRTIARADIDKLYRGAFGNNLRFEMGDADKAGRAVRFEVISSEGKVVDRPIADRMRNDYNSGKSLSKQLLSTWLVDIRVDKSKKALTVKGRGFGHGVGLCQYGAGGMASQGKSYREILGHYFPGAEIQRLYD